MTEPADLPRLTAIFQPQQWIHDNAVDSDRKVEHDVTEALLQLTPDEIRRVYRDAAKIIPAYDDFDEFAVRSGMLGDHEGPFRVEIRDGDIMDLFWVCGFGDLDELDKAGLARMRGMYGFPERVRMPNGQSFVPDEHGFITGEIAVDLDDIIDGSLEKFLDHVSKKLTGTDLLADISYTPTGVRPNGTRSEEHTSELQSLMRISYAVFCLKKKTTKYITK